MHFHYYVSAAVFGYRTEDLTDQRAHRIRWIISVYHFTAEHHGGAVLPQDGERCLLNVEGAG